MASPPPSARPPKVVFWYSLYRVVFLGFALIEIAGGVLLLSYPDLILKGAARLGTLPVETLLGYYYLCVGLLEALIIFVSFLLPRSRFAYSYHLVVMALGILSGFLGMAAVIPLLIFWVRPEVQAYFGWRTELEGPPRKT